MKYITIKGAIVVIACSIVFSIVASVIKLTPREWVAGYEVAHRHRNQEVTIYKPSHVNKFDTYVVMMMPDKTDIIIYGDDITIRELK